MVSAQRLLAAFAIHLALCVAVGRAVAASEDQPWLSTGDAQEAVYEVIASKLREKGHMFVSGGSCFQKLRTLKAAFVESHPKLVPAADVMMFADKCREILARIHNLLPGSTAAAIQVCA
jgi:hypothetical protein